MTDTVADVSEDTGTVMLAARPQPLGAFGLPAGYLLIPAGQDTEAASKTRRPTETSVTPRNTPTLTWKKMTFRVDVARLRIGNSFVGAAAWRRARSASAGPKK